MLHLMTGPLPLANWSCFPVGQQHGNKMHQHLETIKREIRAVKAGMQGLDVADVPQSEINEQDAAGPAARAAEAASSNALQRATMQQRLQDLRQQRQRLQVCQQQARRTVACSARDGV